MNTAYAMRLGYLCLGLGLSAHAATGDPPNKPTIEELQQRIEQLERKLDSPQKNVAAAPAAGSTTSPAPARDASASHPVVEQQATSATENQPQIFAGPGGFSFQSADGANQIRFHGEFDFDGRFYNDGITPEGSRSTWLLGRARPIIEGTFANIFDFRFNPDFAGGKTVIQDAFVAARFNPLFVLTAGKFKEPFGLERLQLSPNNRFISLGLPSDLVPNRDLGLQISGTVDFATGNLIYQFGYFNGVNDGTSSDANATADVDNNDKKDFLARVFSQPFLKTDSAWRGLGAGVAVSYVNQVGTATNTLLPTYKTETQRAFYAYDPARSASNTVTPASPTYADGQRIRLSPQGFYYYKSFGLLAEYVQESQDIARTLGTGSKTLTRRAEIKPESWQVYATYLLTGDDATFGTVKPLRPYAVDQPGWGAFELAARISQLKLDSAIFSAAQGVPGTWFADPSAEARKATAWTLGLNWYLTQNVTWFLDYTVTRFEGGALAGADRPNERGFFTQFQVAF